MRNKLTEDQRGNIVAKAVWKWLQHQKCIEFVPWVLNPDSEQYDPVSAARQEERQSLLADLEKTILDAINV